MFPSHDQDGVIGPGGEMVVSGPKGSIQLDKDDSIIAGTNLGIGKGKNNSSSPSPSSQANTEKTTQTVASPSDKALISKIDQLIAVNQKILAKSPVIEMAGNEVGQGINTDSRAVQ